MLPAGALLVGDHGPGRESPTVHLGLRGPAGGTTVSPLKPATPLDLVVTPRVAQQPLSACPTAGPNPLPPSPVGLQTRSSNTNLNIWLHACKVIRAEGNQLWSPALNLFLPWATKFNSLRSQWKCKDTEFNACSFRKV